MAEAARKAKTEETAGSAAIVKRASEPARATIARPALDGRRSTLLSPKAIQPSLRVSQPSDAAEVEADRVAKAVVSMPDPAPAVEARGGRALSRMPAPAKGGKGAPATDPKVEAEVRAAASGGAPLPAKARELLEPRFRANFAGVRIHTDGNAAKLANKLSARAFAFGNHIFFSGGAYDPNSKGGLELLAHELTHTIQQGETIQRKAADTSGTRVTERTPRQASRLGLSDALDFFADAANAIPGYRMFTILLGVNPINMSAVEASAANILRAIVEFLPGGNIITRVLDSYGIFDKVGGWIEGQLKSLGISGASIKAALTRFMDSLSWRDIFHLGAVWDRAKAIFTEPIGKIISFAKSLFSEILRMVREAVLRPLAALAEGSAGYPLLKVILGFDPVTGEAVQPTADAVIGGLMTLIGQDELWANIKKANAIPRAWAWFKGAMGGLKALVTSIPSRFMTALKGLEIMDFVVLPSAFIKLAKVFGNFMGDFGSWALGTVLDLLKIIVEVVAPGVMPYIAKAGAAFNKILKDPVAFVRTLVRAAVQGFRQFASNFLTHLKASLIGWLTGALGGAGIYIPQGFSLMEIVKFVLSVMGLTWANIRVKLVKATNETTVKVLETGFDIVKTLVTQGPAAAWQKIVETLTNLKQMAIDAVMDFVKSKVVEAAVTKLLSMLSPAGAVIQAIIAIYNTVMFFVERIKQIAAVAASFIDSIATIASGNIGPAANRVEQTMAGLLTLVISFLARIAGLGKVSDAVVGLVNKIRAPIDKALDKVVTWIVETAKKAGKFLLNAVTGGGKKPPANPADARSQAVKDHVRQALAGRSVADRGTADTLLSSTYSRFTGEGLKGLRTRIDLDSPTPRLIVLANASATEEVAALPVNLGGLRAAMDYVYRFNFMRGKTILQVYYDDDSKRLDGIISNEPDMPGKPHAEEVFIKDHLPGLATRIRAERAAGTLKAKPGAPIKIELNLNRLPCGACSSILSGVAGRYPDMRFLVRASSVSNTGSASNFVTSESEAHIEFIKTMIQANIDVEPLPIFDEIWKKMLQIGGAVQAGKLTVKSGSLGQEINSAKVLMNSGMAETIKVRELIDAAKKRAALGKVPPKGSAP